MTEYSDAEIIAIKTAAYEEASKFCDRYRRALEDILWANDLRDCHLIARKALR